MYVPQRSPTPNIREAQLRQIVSRVMKDPRIPPAFAKRGIRNGEAIVRAVAEVAVGTEIVKTRNAASLRRAEAARGAWEASAAIVKADRDAKLDAAAAAIAKLKSDVEKIAEERRFLREFNEVITKAAARREDAGRR